MVPKELSTLFYICLVPTPFRFNRGNFGHTLLLLTVFISLPNVLKNINLLKNRNALVQVFGPTTLAIFCWQTSTVTPSYSPPPRNDQRQLFCSLRMRRIRSTRKSFLWSQKGAKTFVAIAKILHTY